MIGKEKDALDAWLSNLKRRFLAEKANVLGAVKDGLLAFNLDEKADTVKLADRAKNISGRACRSFPAYLMNTFDEWLGKPVPSG